MLPDSIGSLYNLLKSGGINVLLAGGWAVNEHGYARETRDVDWVANESQKSAALEVMRSARFKPGSDSALVTRFIPPSPGIPIVDLLWVDAETFAKLYTNKSHGGPHQSIPILHLEHLIGMKIHALKNHKERKGRDLLDIRHLLEANPGVISDDDLLTLCEKFGPSNAYNLITEP